MGVEDSRIGYTLGLRCIIFNGRLAEAKWQHNTEFNNIKQRLTDPLKVG